MSQPVNYQFLARNIVFNFIEDRIEDHDMYNSPLYKNVTLSDIYVVWFSKTLQNWKALVATSVDDGYYYEVTYDGDKNQVYLDQYSKVLNVCIDGGGSK